MYEKPTVIIFIDGERLNAFSLSSGRRQLCLLSPLLFIKASEVLATEIRKKKERERERQTERRKGKAWKEEINCPYLQMA